MGLTCKPVDKFKSIMRKMENKLVAAKIKNKIKKEHKRTKELETT